jgi:transcriptional regulator with XRE-family HTH domain
MFFLTAECVVASLLVPYLQGEMDQRGWSATDLAAKSGISKSNISKLFQHPERIPQTQTLAKLARGLDVPFMRLVKLLGLGVDDDTDGAPPDAARVAILFESMPELKEAVENWAMLSPEYQRALVAYAEGLRRQQSQA